jgi:hypothetical protein
MSPLDKQSSRVRLSDSQVLQAKDPNAATAHTSTSQLALWEDTAGGGGNFDYEVFLSQQAPDAPAAGGKAPKAAKAPKAPKASAPAARPTLKKGSKGPDVIYLQQKVGTAADGDFGPNTTQGRCCVSNI